MIFRQLFDSVSGTYSYLLASRAGGEALIIDPVLEKVDRYLQLIARTRSQAGQGGRHPSARRPHHRPRRAARPHPLHHRHGREHQGRRGVDAACRRRQADHRRRQPGRALYARPHRRLLFVPDGRPRLYRRHAVDPRHRPHRFPERRRAHAIRIAVRQIAAAAGRDLGVSGARLQRRHGLHHRRGEALQSAPAGQIGRRLCRADGEPEPAQSENDGCRCAVQHEGRPGASRTSRAAAGR